VALVLEIREGAASILAPDKGPERGPASSEMPVFYNPAMGVVRDMCVLAVGRLGASLSRPLRAVDGLSGTGVRAIRLALESGCRFEALTANDRSLEAFELIQDNIMRNGCGGTVSALRSDLNALLSQERFDYIDIDPFGPPVDFLPAAARAVRHKGLIGVTATDTGPLCGTNPTTCWRRYGAVSMRSEHMHETAARILAGFCVRLGAQADVALRPVLTQSDDHYIRLYLRAERSISRANEALGELGYLGPERKLLRMDEGAPARGKAAGPLWLGELWDRDFLDEVCKAFNDRMAASSMAGQGAPPPFANGRRLARLLEPMKEEAGLPPFFFELDECAKKYRSGPPRMAALLEALGKAGFRASRTHFAPTGVRTDAPAAELERLFVAASKPGAGNREP
jgi:tRNA (guanine26-N2/guanine27-N2)-dimethyltransferase